MCFSFKTHHFCNNYALCPHCPRSYHGPKTETYANIPPLMGHAPVKLCPQYNMAAPESGRFCLKVCTVGGSEEDASSIFIYYGMEKDNFGLLS